MLKTLHMDAAVETKYVRYRFLPGDILYAVYKEDVLYIDDKMAWHIIESRLAQHAGRPLKLIVQENGGAEFTLEARKVFASEAGLQDILAIAIIVDNPVSFATGAFLLDEKQPTVPIRFCANMDEALAFLLPLPVKSGVCAWTND
jgi:hypothetical protein